MKVDSETQLFLLLVWLITTVALLAAIWLFKEARQLSTEAKEKTPAPYVIPQEEAKRPQPNKWGFTIPPPPF